MKILMLTDSMDIGGAETHVYELSRSLSLMGHKVKIFSGGGKTAELLKDTGIELEEHNGLSRLTSLPSVLCGLLRSLRNFKPDVVHAHTRRMLLVAQAAKKIIPFPLVFTAHARFSPSGLKRFFTDPPAHTIAVSEDIKAHFYKEFGAKSITVIKNGIDVSKFSQARIPKNRFSIVHVSRIDKDSSLCAELLCRIAPRLRNIYNGLEICIVGSGSDHQRICTLAKKVNAAMEADVIKAVGAQSDVLEYLRRGSVFVGVSRSALEAMCMGLPTIICGNEGYFGICDSKSFHICARENFCARGYGQATDELLFKDLSHVLSNGGDDLSALVNDGYSSRTMAKKTDDVYKSAVADHLRSLSYDAVICGYYGFGNLGDELVLSQIKKAVSGARIAVIGAKGDGRINRCNPIAIIKAIRSSSLFILGGGSLLQNSTSSRSLNYYLLILRIANLFGRKVLLYANGIGPLHGDTAKDKCRLALSHTDAAGFRDSDSFKLAKTLLPPSAYSYLTCDPALLIIPHKPVKNRITVIIRGEDASETLSSAIKGAITKFLGKISTSTEIAFVPMNLKKDEKAARRLARSMPFKSIIFKTSDTADLINFIASSKIILSSRLHALIIAASAGRPFVALCHDPKLESFSKDCLIDKIMHPQIKDEDIEKRIYTALLTAHACENELCTKLISRINVLRERANTDQRVIESLLPQIKKRGGSD